MAVMNLLARIKPDNMTQAESIVRQARDQSFDTGEQTDMLGTLVVAESLFLERAKVLDAAGKALRRDRAVFNSLIDNQARIEAEGNVLSTAANQTKERVDAQAIEIIQKVANRKGSVSDSLTEAARQLKEGDAAGATKAFVSAIRDAIQRGDFDGVDVGAEGRAFDAPPETSRLAASPSRDTLDAFDDPAVGAARQADQLEVDEFGATVRETAQPDVELREDLRRIVDAGAKPDEIDAHPAITEALARAMALDETHLDARYGTPAGHSQLHIWRRDNRWL